MELQPVAVPSRLGQGTAVEQSRAAAEVQAAVVVAQQVLRNVQGAVAELEEVCRLFELADRAFYSYKRGMTTIRKPSVHLARELARCWGNVQYGLIELRRDDVYGQSEMQAFAWDVQKNSRVSSTFVVPHRRDTKDGVTELTALRDVYENNANNGARRLREAIFSVLPGWYVAKGVSACEATLKDGGGVPLPQRIADGVKRFEGLGVTVRQLETERGRDSSDWTAHDVAELGVLYRSLERREITVEEAFPSVRVTADEVEQQEQRAVAAAREQADEHSQAVAEVRACAERAGVEDVERWAWELLGAPMEEVSARAVRELLREMNQSESE